VIRVLIADDHEILRKGLKSVFEMTPDITVSMEAANGVEVMCHLTESDQVDILLLDFSMPGLSGVALIEKIKKSYPHLPIIIFSMHNQSQLATRVFKAGASGYVVKDSDMSILLLAVYAVFSGNKYIDPSLITQIAFEAAFPQTPHTLLSKRELEVFNMLVSGKTQSEIATQLCLSPKTVSTHKKRLMEKMKFTNFVDLLNYAAEHKVSFK
jgi:DNA-binding NarL/FixJ family response regulator